MTMLPFNNGQPRWSIGGSAIYNPPWQKPQPTPPVVSPPPPPVAPMPPLVAPPQPGSDLPGGGIFPLGADGTSGQLSLAQILNGGSFGVAPPQATGVPQQNFNALGKSLMAQVLNGQAR